MTEPRAEQRTLALPATSRRRILNRLALRVTQGPDAGKLLEHYQEGTVTVGTASDAELRLRDPTVSSYHLEVRPHERGVQLLDLGSLNGTFVAGMSVRDAVVPLGTAIGVGRSVLVVEDGTCVDVPEPEPAPDYPGLVGSSAALEQVRRAIATLAASSVSVLILGETGTGKELVANAIHESGARADGPLVTVDCGSLPQTLIASQLFGHERGAFTGADRRYIGAFERAHGGSIFLDEIGELPLSVQPALLGGLERRRFRRLGGTHEIEVDVRVIAATNRDLRAAANRKEFRLDLYYRLAVARVVIPPLRERPEDIPHLVRHFVREATGSVENTPFDADGLESLQKQRWPGNVRELRNLIDRSLAMGHAAFETYGGGSEQTGDALLPYKDARAIAITQFERTYLERLIGTTDGNASAAARAAKMDRQYLLQLLRKHGLR
jgi:DNA-binding NtrC family response regulator